MLLHRNKANGDNAITGKLALLITIAATGWIFRKQVGQPSLAANWLGELASQISIHAPAALCSLVSADYNVLVALIWLVTMTVICWILSTRAS